jgi:hypothetical protein
MERVCRQKTGLFPSPHEIQLSCSCPDWAGMCKHVAAVLYGIGARLDQQPELCSGCTVWTKKSSSPGRERRFRRRRRRRPPARCSGAKTFRRCLDWTWRRALGRMPEWLAPITAKPKRAKARAGKKVPAVVGRKGKVRAKGSAGKRRKQAT